MRTRRRTRGVQARTAWLWAPLGLVVWAAAAAPAPAADRPNFVVVFADDLATAISASSATR